MLDRRDLRDIGRAMVSAVAHLQDEDSLEHIGSTLLSFLNAEGFVVRPETARQIIREREEV